MAKSSRGKASKAAGQASSSTPKSDDRFSALRFNPKFSQAGKDHAKVKVDERFSAMFEDEEFSAGGSGAKVDKYGRKKKKKERTKGAELKQFYKLETDSNDNDNARDASSKSAASKSDSKQQQTKKKKKSASDEKKEQEDERLDYLTRLARGEVSDNSSSDDDDDDDSADDAASSDDDQDAGQSAGRDAETGDDGDEEGVDEGVEEVPTGDESCRLAVQNCDWSNVTAQDLFAVMNSFVPTVGRIEKITIYPSQYGQKMMALEERNGPMLDGDDRERAMHGDNSDDDDDDDGALKPHNGFEMADEGEGYDTEKLRKYELNKLKYYFAVVVCDSVETASVLYRECDGVEFERSSIVLDLRFIPDEVDVSQQPIHDEATRVAVDYKPVDFVSKALQSSAVDLTWDDEETRERQDLRGWGQQAPGKQMKGSDMVTERDLERFIGSEDDESDAEEDADAARAKYRQLLSGVFGAETKGEQGEDQDDDDDDDAENPNFEDESDSSDEDEGADDGAATLENSLLESEMRSKHRLVRGMRGKNEQGKIIGSDGKEIVAKGFNDPFFASGAVKKLKKRDAKTGKIKNAKQQRDDESNDKKRKKASGNKDDDGDSDAGYDSEASHGGFGREEATSKAELELLMADADESKLQGFDFRTIVEGEKLLGKKTKLRGKKKRRKQAAMEVAKSDTFELDTSDKRFQALYEDSTFQVDKTNPQYVETRTMRTIQTERAKRRMRAEESDDQAASSDAGKKSSSSRGVGGGSDKSRTSSSGGKSGAGSGKSSGSASLSALVDSIKRKSRK